VWCSTKITFNVYVFQQSQIQFKNADHAVYMSFRWVTTTLSLLRTTTCDALIVPSEGCLVLPAIICQPLPIYFPSSYKCMYLSTYHSHINPNFAFSHHNQKNIIFILLHIHVFQVLVKPTFVHNQYSIVIFNIITLLYVHVKYLYYLHNSEFRVLYPFQYTCDYGRNHTYLYVLIPLVSCLSVLSLPFMLHLSYISLFFSN